MKSIHLLRHIQSIIKLTGLPINKIGKLLN